MWGGFVVGRVADCVGGIFFHTGGVCYRKEIWMQVTIFTGSKCRACEVCKRIFSELSEHNKMKVRCIDVEDDKNVVEVRKNAIRSLPTVVINHNKKEWKFEGNVNKQSWKKKIRENFGIELKDET
jgi:glutaredoxin